MRIQLTDNYFVDQTSEVEYTLYKKVIIEKGKNKGQTRYSAIGYYGNLKGAVKALIQAKLYAKKMTVSLQGFLEEYQKMLEEINNYIKG